MGDMNLELLLGMAYGQASGGSSGGSGTGTTNYAALTNKPKINNVTLDGNRSLSDLGIENYDDAALSGRVDAVETALSGKANTADLADVATSGSYNDLDDKPTIPSAYDDTALTGRVSALETDVQDLKTNGASVTVDDTLSDTSENPVQNKAIKAALDGLSVSGVVVDTALSDTSENPVQNKVIKAALDGKANSTDIPAAYDDTEIKTALASKTNDADLATVAKSGAYNDLTGLPTIPAETPIATQTVAGKVKAGNGVTITADGTLSVQTPSNQGYVDSTTIMDYIDETHSIDKWDSADTAKANKESIVLPEWALQSEVDAVANAGAKNLFPNVKFGQSETVNGVTFIVNADGSVTINGKNTATAANQCYIQLGRITIKKGSYIMSGVPEGYADKLWVWGAGVAENKTESEKSITLAADVTASFGVTIAVGDTQFDNVTVYPMLRDAAIKDDAYVPYAMSNVQITEELSDTGWLTLTNGITYRKKNGIVFVNMQNNTQAQTTTNAELGTLPEGFKPSSNIVTVGVTNQFASYLGINITTNGEIRTRVTTGTGTGYYAYISFPI